MDQRKVNMLAREYCDAAEPKIKFKPVILSHREWFTRNFEFIFAIVTPLRIIDEYSNTFSLQP